MRNTYIKILFSFLVFLWAMPSYFTYGMTSHPSSGDSPFYGASDYETYMASRNENLRKADEELIQKTTAEFGSQMKAGQVALGYGWQYLQKGDSKSAIKRFNQAMLLMGHDLNVYWGFGASLKAQKRYDQAVKMYRMGRSFYKPEQLIYEWDYVTFLRDYGIVLPELMQETRDEKQGMALVDELIEVTAEAIRDSHLQKNDTIGTDVYALASYAFFIKENYSESWRNIQLARKDFPKAFEGSDLAQRMLVLLKDKRTEPEPVL